MEDNDMEGEAAGEVPGKRWHGLEKSCSAWVWMAVEEI